MDFDMITCVCDQLNYARVTKRRENDKKYGDNNENDLIDLWNNVQCRERYIYPASLVYYLQHLQFHGLHGPFGSWL